MIIALQILILFRESVLTLLHGWLPPFCADLVRKLSENGCMPVKEDIEEQVFADFDDEFGVVFFPPVYAQRYAAVCDCLMDERWFGRLEKVLNIGKHYDTNFMRYLTEVSGVTHILGLDITCSLNCTCDVLDIALNGYERWESPLQVTLLQGNAADPDYRLIGCDAVIAIETIQKLLPHDLDRLVHNVFGFVKPWVALFTTPNADFNCLLKNLNRNGLRQSDHYFEWTREQLHDWCSNIVRRYPEYVVMSMGVGPGPRGTSHYGCFSQLVLFMSKHYQKEMELNVNSIVMISNLPEPEQRMDIGWPTNLSATSSQSVVGSLHSGSTELSFTQAASNDNELYSESMVVRCADKSVQCNVEVEFGKKFIMFNDDEMYQTVIPRKRLEGKVYEIGDVERRLNNTMYNVKHFSQTTRCLMERNLITSTALMDEILQLADKLTYKINLSSGDEGHVWNNVNWGENVPFWNQYYKLMGEYNFPYEGKSEDEMILELLSEETNKIFEKNSQGSNFGIPVEMLMDSVKHITDDVERVIMLMEDSGYELEGESVVYTGLDFSETSHNEEFDSNYDSDCLSYGSSSARDFNGRLLNRTLGRKIKMLRLLLPKEEDIKKAVARVICRLKKIAISSAPGRQGPAQSKWLQLKLLELLTLTEKSIMRQNRQTFLNDPYKDLRNDNVDEIASHLSRINAENDLVLRIVEKYDALRTGTFTENNTSVGESQLNDEIPEYTVAETDDLSHELLTRYTSDEQHIDCVQDWEENDMSVYEEEEHRCINSPKHKRKKWSTEIPLKTTVRSTKKEIPRRSSRFGKKNSKHRSTFVAAKKSLNTPKKFYSCDVFHSKKYNARNNSQMVVNKMTYDTTLDCIDNMRKKMGPTLVLSVPPKPIPGCILELCHPELHQETTAAFPKTNYAWASVLDPPIAATEDSRTVEILSQSATTTVALQRMIGTDPDVDAEIYKHDLALSDLTSLMNDTLDSPIAATEDSQTVEILSQSATATVVLQRMIGTDPDVTSLMNDTLDSPIAATEDSQTVEILSQSATTTVVLQRMIGTDPDVTSLMNDTLDSPIATTEDSRTVEILSQSATTTVALQRMIGTDPDVTSLMNDTLDSPIAATEDSQTVEILSQSATRTVVLQRMFGTDPDETSLMNDTLDSPIATTEDSRTVEILSQSATTTVALQRMIGTDPDVDAKIYKHDLNLSDLTSLMNDTSYLARTEEISRAVYDLSGVIPPAEECSAALKHVVEIVTQDGQEFISLQRTIGTDPDIDTDVCEQELQHSKLTTSLSNMVSFEKFPVGLGNVTSQEFFLYDLNEPTTSKGIRHEGMDVQCGTEGLISATTSFSCPLKKFDPTLEFKHSYRDVRSILKNDCVTSTQDILKPCDSVASHWMKSVGIKIKDSNDHITDISNETDTFFGPFAINDRATCVDRIDEKSVLIKTLLSHHVDTDDLDHPKEKNNLKAKHSHSSGSSQSKLSCGGVHVHSYKDVQVSEDIVYQGKWQRYRRSCNPKKLNPPPHKSMDRRKLTCKKSPLLKPQNPTPVVRAAVTTPIIIRNTKANKMKENLMKSHMQNKLLTKKDVPRNPSKRQGKKVSNRSTISSKPIKEISGKLMQPPSRYSQSAARPTIITKEKTTPTNTTTQKRKNYIPPYLEKIKKKQQMRNTPSKIMVKKDTVNPSMLNLVDENNEQTKMSQFHIDALLSALVKVSIEPQPDLSYVVYRNKMETSNSNSTVQNIPLNARPSSKENILRRKHSHLGTNNSSYTPNSAGTAIPRRKKQTAQMISSPKRKGLERKMFSTINKLKNMFSKNSQALATKQQSLINLNNSQNSVDKTLNDDSSLDRTANNSPSSKEPSKTSIIQSFVDSSKTKNGSCLTDKNEEYCEKQESKTTLVFDQSISSIQDVKTDSVHDCTGAESITHKPENTQILLTNPEINSFKVSDSELISNTTEESNKSKTNDNSHIFNAMKELVEECLNFEVTYELMEKSNNADSKRSDGKFDITSIGSETYKTVSSIPRTDDNRSVLSSLASLTRSFIDCSQPSDSKMSESFTDENRYPFATPIHQLSEIQTGNKDTISITQKPKAGSAFSSFSVNTQPSPLELSRKPDYVNLVDSETGSCARTTRRATSEEVLVSSRSSSSYMSCVLDEEAAVPSWLYNINQAASSSLSTSRHGALPEDVPELEIDVNGNELTAQGAGAGDGCGIHSDISHDSSGEGTSFSSSASSTVQSESLVVDPGAFLQGFAPPGERPGSSAVAAAEESNDTLNMELPEASPPRPGNRSRIPRIARRISLPASDADISSSLDTDFASD